jgi:hypothetical protein
MGGKELPARREATGFCGFGKAGTGKCRRWFKTGFFAGAKLVSRKIQIVG